MLTIFVNPIMLTIVQLISIPISTRVTWCLKKSFKTFTKFFKIFTIFFQDFYNFFEDFYQISHVDNCELSLMPITTRYTMLKEVLKNVYQFCLDSCQFCQDFCNFVKIFTIFWNWSRSTWRAILDVLCPFQPPFSPMKCYFF